MSPAEATFDLFEALALDPADDGWTTPDTAISDPGYMFPYLDDGRELIPDEPFRGSGIALEEAEAQAAAQNLFRATPSPCHSATSQGFFKTLSRSQVSKPQLRSKNKRKRIAETKAHLLNEISNSISPLPENIPSRWTFKDFTTTMNDIFSGRAFKRDSEGSRPIFKFGKEDPKVDRGERISMGSIGSVTTIKTTETVLHHRNSRSPFMDSGYSTPRTVSNFSLPLPTSPVQRDGFVAKRPSSETTPARPRADTPRMTFEDLLFPSPPPKRNRRLSPLEAPLQPIPERLTTVLPPLDSANTPHELFVPTEGEPKPGYITLSSTPFSLTSPPFRHGPIRVDRRRMNFSPEEAGLDWTAFQMAMLGVMDDHDTENDDADWRLGEAELGEMTSWFSGFGFGIGKMVKEVCVEE